MENRPSGREKDVTAQTGSLHRRGEGTGSGPVGSGKAGGFEKPKPTISQTSSGGTTSAGSGEIRGVRGRSPLTYVIPLILLLLGGGGAGLSGLLGGGSSETPSTGYTTTTTTTTGSSTGTTAVSTGSSMLDLVSLFGGASSSSSAMGWSGKANTGTLDTSVASSAREKRTVIAGGGEDKVTILVYMCGTDLESRSGMATADLTEMAKATLNDDLNIIVYTGGCKAWKTTAISSSVNQIYQIQSGGIRCLVPDDGDKAMTDPKTLSAFIKWGAEKFPANRMNLIFWDHGGGSVSGYGYDEKHKNAGGMNLAGIKQALEGGGVTFDFIGFDACLMATMETALMLDEFADYLIASEETEPGVGWYYTNWLTKYAADTSMPTIQVGRMIVDDFVDTCATKCQGQKTTLSVIDLAELSATVPSELSDFSKSVSKLITDKQYQTVSSARNGCREFATSSKIDQVDLVHLAENMGTQEGKDLASAIKGAVKYNRTSVGMTNAYGISIYFPYQRTSYVDNAVNTYDAIGMDESYADCIKAFASMETAGQVVAGGSSSASPLSSLMGSGLSSGGIVGDDMIGSLLTSFLSGGFGTIEGLSGANTSFFTGKSLSTEEMAAYVGENQFDGTLLTWSENSEGKLCIHLPDEQWKLVSRVDQNIFYDDGQGYIDLGLDNLYTFDNDGNLIADTDGTWLSVNAQIVAYYHVDTAQTEEGEVITGYIPALVNGNRSRLIVVFDTRYPKGHIVGYEADYGEDETEMSGKVDGELQMGDTVDFLCDYYSYDGTFEDSFLLGEQMVVGEDIVITNMFLPEGDTRMIYVFTDLYNQKHWSEAYTE